MTCKHCDSKLRKVCNRFKKYDEFKCKLEVSYPDDSMDVVSSNLVDEFLMELEDMLFGEDDE